MSFLTGSAFFVCLISIQERAKINFKNKPAKTFSIQKVN